MILGCGGCRNETKTVATSDALWDKGNKVAAVSAYKELYVPSFWGRSISPSEKERCLIRIVDFEVRNGTVDEANTWIKRGLKDNVKADYTDPVSKQLLGYAETERDMAVAEKAKKEKEAAAIAKSKAEEERKTISYEVLKQIPRGDRKLIIDVLVSERATKQEVLKLANNLRREYAGKYGVITIYDSRVASQRHHDETYPEKELFLHWLVEIADWNEGKEIQWLAPERDH